MICGAMSGDTGFYSGAEAVYNGRKSKGNRLDSGEIALSENIVSNPGATYLESLPYSRFNTACRLLQPAPFCALFHTLPCGINDWLTVLLHECAFLWRRQDLQHHL